MYDEHRRDFFSQHFFLLQKKIPCMFIGHTRNFTLHWVWGDRAPPPTKMSTPSIPGYLNDGNGTGNGTVYLQNHNTWSVMVRLNKRGNVHRNSDGKCIEFFLSPLLSDLFFLRWHFWAIRTNFVRNAHIISKKVINVRSSSKCIATGMKLLNTMNKAC